MAQRAKRPWYADTRQDVLFYLFIAIFFVEMIVGGIAFFYGIIHAQPETAGGPPVARFPWLGWIVTSILAPIGVLLITHLAGSLLSRSLEEPDAGKPDGDENLPEGMKRFYASVRHAPVLVILVGILLLGVGLFFVEGAFSALMRLCVALLPYLPWILGSLAALLAFCFLARYFFIYRQRKMENEYAWRREVLAKTGLVLVDKASVALPRSEAQQALIAPEEEVAALPQVLEIEAASTPSEKPDSSD